MSGELSVRIGGDAGQGLESSGAGFCKALARSGLHVFAAQDYRSRIRGGHNFYQIRASDEPVHAKSDPPQLLLALTPQTVDAHKGQLAPGAGVLYEESFGVDAEDLAASGLSPMPAPLMEIAAAHGSRVMMNTAGLAALAAVADFPLEFVASVIRDNFARKGEEVVAANLDVAAEAHGYARDRYGGFPHCAPEGDGRRRSPPACRRVSRSLPSATGVDRPGLYDEADWCACPVRGHNLAPSQSGLRNASGLAQCRRVTSCQVHRKQIVGDPERRSRKLARYRRIRSTYNHDSPLVAHAVEGGRRAHCLGRGAVGPGREGRQAAHQPYPGSPPGTLRPGRFLGVGEKRYGMRHTPGREGSPYWLIVARQRAPEDVFLIEEDGGSPVLPVFGSEEEARLFLSSCEEGWEAREVSSLELISLLVGEGNVKRVALDPVAGEDPALVSTGWGVFLDSLLGRGRHWFENRDGYHDKAR